MPYIIRDKRKKYDKFLNKIKEIESKGALEYCVTKLQKIFMKTRENRYSFLHEAVYAVTHAADEFRRRHLDKREDEAIKKNGDIT